MDSLGTVSNIQAGLYTYKSAHRPWSVRDTWPIINGTIFYCPIGCHASWESMKQLWESSEMSGPIAGPKLLTVGIIVPNKEWARALF